MTENPSQVQHGAQPDGAQPGLPIVGHRRAFYFNDAGQPAYRVDELTAEDFLNPQPDDIFEHGAHHAESVRQLAGMLRHHYRYSPTASVPQAPQTPCTAMAPTTSSSFRVCSIKRALP